MCIQFHRKIIRCNAHKGSNRLTNGKNHIPHRTCFGIDGYRIAQQMICCLNIVREHNAQCIQLCARLCDHLAALPANHVDNFLKITTNQRHKFLQDTGTQINRRFRPRGLCLTCKLSRALKITRVGLRYRTNQLIVVGVAVFKRRPAHCLRFLSTDEKFHIIAPFATLFDFQVSLFQTVSAKVSGRSFTVSIP